MFTLKEDPGEFCLLYMIGLCSTLIEQYISCAHEYNKFANNKLCTVMHVIPEYEQLTFRS